MLSALLPCLARGVEVVEVDHRDRSALRRRAAVLGLAARRHRPQASREYRWKQMAHVANIIVLVLFRRHIARSRGRTESERVPDMAGQIARSCGRRFQGTGADSRLPLA